MGWISPLRLALVGSLLYLRQGAELVGIGLRLGQHLLCDVRVVEHDQPRAHRRAVLGLEGVVDFLLRGLDPLGSQFAQRQSGPDDVVAILIRTDAALLLQHLHPLIDGDRELFRQASDFLVDVLARDLHAPLFAIAGDQVLIHHAFEHFRAELRKAFLSEFITLDLFAIHDRDNILLR